MSFIFLNLPCWLYAHAVSSIWDVFLPHNSLTNIYLFFDFLLKCHYIREVFSDSLGNVNSSCTCRQCWVYFLFMLRAPVTNMLSVSPCLSCLPLNLLRCLYIISPQAFTDCKSGLLCTAWKFFRWKIQRMWSLPPFSYNNGVNGGCQIGSFSHMTWNFGFIFYYYWLLLFITQRKFIKYKILNSNPQQLKWIILFFKELWFLSKSILVFLPNTAIRRRKLLIVKEKLTSIIPKMFIVIIKIGGGNKNMFIVIIKIGEGNKNMCKVYAVWY